MPINPIFITTGTHPWKRIIPGETHYQMLIAFVKSVLTFWTVRKRLNGKCKQLQQIRVIRQVRFYTKYIQNKPFKIMFNSFYYGELVLDEWNVLDLFDDLEIHMFPLSKQQYEDAVNDQVAHAEAYYENQIADHYSC